MTLFGDLTVCVGRDEGEKRQYVQALMLIAGELAAEADRDAQANDGNQSMRELR